MNIKDINKNPTPIVRMDASLEKQKGKVLFPDKVAIANKTISSVGLPNSKVRKGA